MISDKFDPNRLGSKPWEAGPMMDGKGADVNTMMQALNLNLMQKVSPTDQICDISMS